MVTEFERQSIVDEEHLKLLSIGYWVWGGVMAAYSLFIGAYFMFMGFIFTSIPDGADAAPDFLRWFFPIVGIVVFGIAGTFAGLQIANGFWIRKRTHHVLSMVVAGFTCAMVPVGTMLGVCSFVVLVRPTVRALYGQPPGSPQVLVPVPIGDGSDPSPDNGPLT